MLRPWHLGRKTKHDLKALCFKCKTFPLSDFFNISLVMSVGKNKNRRKKVSLRIFRLYHDFDGIQMLVVDHFPTA